MTAKLSHVDASGKARMVDVSLKPDTVREARARVTLHVRPATLRAIRQGEIAKGDVLGVARLAGIEIPKHEDTEKTFAELKARIEKTIAFIETVKPAQIDGTEDKDLTIKLGAREVQWKGMQYLLGFALPNFYFHAATAYDILRHNGVELAKRDFIGNV